MSGQLPGVHPQGFIHVAKDGRCPGQHHRRRRRHEPDGGANNFFPRSGTSGGQRGVQSAATAADGNGIGRIENFARLTLDSLDFGFFEPRIVVRQKGSAPPRLGFQDRRHTSPRRWRNTEALGDGKELIDAYFGFAAITEASDGTLTAAQSGLLALSRIVVADTHRRFPGIEPRFRDGTIKDGLRDCGKARARPCHKTERSRKGLHVNQLGIAHRRRLGSQGRGFAVKDVADGCRQLLAT